MCIDGMTRSFFTLVSQFHILVGDFYSALLWVVLHVVESGTSQLSAYVDHHVC